MAPARRIRESTGWSSPAEVLGPSAELFAGRSPFLWVRGNHEARGAYARQLQHYMASPNGSRSAGN